MDRYRSADLGLGTPALLLVCIPFFSELSSEYLSVV